MTISTSRTRNGGRRIDRVLAEDFAGRPVRARPRRPARPSPRGRAGGGRPVLHPADAPGPDGHPAGRAGPPRRRRREQDRRAPRPQVLADSGAQRPRPRPLPAGRAVPGRRAPPRRSSSSSPTSASPTSRATPTTSCAQRLRPARGLRAAASPTTAGAVQNVMDALHRRGRRPLQDGAAASTTCSPSAEASAVGRGVPDRPDRSDLLAEVVRSGFVEGHHRGSVVALAADGSRVLWRSATPTPPSSPARRTSRCRPSACSRPASTCDGELLALACASHSGEAFHLDGVRRIARRGRPRRVGAADARPTARSTRPSGTRCRGRRRTRADR